MVERQRKWIVPTVSSVSKRPSRSSRVVSWFITELWVHALMRFLGSKSWGKKMLTATAWKYQALVCEAGRRTHEEVRRVGSTWMDWCFKTEFVELPYLVDCYSPPSWQGFYEYTATTVARNCPGNSRSGLGKQWCAVTASLLLWEGKVLVSLCRFISSWDFWKIHRI